MGKEKSFQDVERAKKQVLDLEKKGEQGSIQS
jgi:hypothetical protein